MSQFRIVRSRGGYAVLNADGTQVGGLSSSHAVAERVVQRLEQAGRNKRRPCMCCGTTFTSEGPHNRLCAHCRTRSSALPPEAPVPSRNGTRHR